MGYVILLWHSLGLPYNYFVCYWCLFRSSIHLCACKQHEPLHKKTPVYGFQIRSDTNRAVQGVEDCKRLEISDL